jgi:hypothetical protein
MTTKGKIVFGIGGALFIAAFIYGSKVIDRKSRETRDVRKAEQRGYQCLPCSSKFPFAKGQINCVRPNERGGIVIPC